MSSSNADQVVQERGRKVHCSECCRDFYSDSADAFNHYCPWHKGRVTLKPAEGFNYLGERVPTPKQIAEAAGITGRLSEADIEDLAIRLREDKAATPLASSQKEAIEAAVKAERERCLEAVIKTAFELKKLSSIYPYHLDFFAAALKP